MDVTPYIANNYVLIRATCTILPLFEFKGQIKNDNSAFSAENSLGNYPIPVPWIYVYKLNDARIRQNIIVVFYIFF